MLDASSKGYQVIWSIDGLYYLDALNEVWETFYDQDLLAGITNATQAALVLGGETVRAARGLGKEGGCSCPENMRRCLLLNTRPPTAICRRCGARQRCGDRENTGTLER